MSITFEVILLSSFVDYHVLYTIIAELDIYTINAELGISASFDEKERDY